MDCCLSYNRPAVLNSLPSTVKPVKASSFTSSSNFTFNLRLFRPLGCLVRTSNRRALIVEASAEASRSQCDYSGLNTPLQPKSPAGKFLSSVLLNDRGYFHVAVAEQLEQLVADSHEALTRMNLSLGSDEACLHRRIAGLREHECQTAVEDVMYMLIFYKFSEIRVHLVPRLSQCIYNGRLEIWPSKDWELESIHSLEVLEMIREHLTTVVGWRANSNVTDNWATTQIQRLQLCRIYAASILYGYFLKSAALRHYLELSLDEVNYDLGISTDSHSPCSELWSYGSKNIVFGQTSRIRTTSLGQLSYSQEYNREKLKGYVMGFDPETLQMCAKPKSKVAVNLIEKHSCALFADEKMGLLETGEVISTSLASLKRLVLEAIAFGSFLWDTEEYVNSVCKLAEN
ncbi:unnamed protein product [Ilex paraguariensis]|uniref:UV-B-induced protein At3g17800, chloroplastic-like n=1 Tax=Ilex paraguariensis TaxID=185542 RepID=A0ABC8R7C0_9AQUA